MTQVVDRLSATTGTVFVISSGTTMGTPVDANYIAASGTVDGGSAYRGRRRPAGPAPPGLDRPAHQGGTHAKPSSAYSVYQQGNGRADVPAALDSPATQGSGDNLTRLAHSGGAARELACGAFRATGIIANFAGPEDILRRQGARAGPATTRVLVLTTFDEDDHVYGALRAGARGFVVNDMALDDILAAIRVVAAGDALVAPGVMRRLIADFVGRHGSAPERSPRPVEGITERQREVLTLIGRGRSNTEIAEDLFITVATAKSHVSRLSTKLSARDRVQLVITAYETGLVTPAR
jgi:DNA-binding NarL/FixJ family response regulator